MLALNALSKTYPNGTRALHGLSLTLNQGDIVALVGGSGCGKSSLLRIIAGLDLPTQGQAELDGMPIRAPNEKIGLIFQEPRLFSWLNVEKNVGFGLRHLPKAQRAQKVDAVLDVVGLSHKAQALPRELSGGQAQRVAIARALVCDPEVLLLDEPFSALDPFTRADLHNHVLTLWAAKAVRPTLIVVTHDVDEAIVLANRIIVMHPNPGRIAAEIHVDLPRPRERGPIEFEALRRRVMQALNHDAGVQEVLS